MLLAALLPNLDCRRHRCRHNLPTMRLKVPTASTCAYNNNAAASAAGKASQSTTGNSVRETPIWLSVRPLLTSRPQAFLGATSNKSATATTPTIPYCFVPERFILRVLATKRQYSAVALLSFSLSRRRLQKFESNGCWSVRWWLADAFFFKCVSST